MYHCPVCGWDDNQKEKIKVCPDCGSSSVEELPDTLGEDAVPGEPQNDADINREEKNPE